MLLDQNKHMKQLNILFIGPASSGKSEMISTLTSLPRSFLRTIEESHQIFHHETSTLLNLIEIGGNNPQLLISGIIISYNLLV
jgi:predicted ATPase